MSETNLLTLQTYSDIMGHDFGHKVTVFMREGYKDIGGCDLEVVYKDIL